MLLVLLGIHSTLAEQRNKSLCAKDCYQTINKKSKVVSAHSLIKIFFALKNIPLINQTHLAIMF